MKKLSFILTAALAVFSLNISGCKNETSLNDETSGMSKFKVEYYYQNERLT